MKATTQAMVGAFVLGGIGLALAAVVMFGKLDLFGGSIQAAVVFQDSIAGLSVGAPVTFRGVRVGSVENIAIEFEPKSNTAYIPVTIRLTPSQASTQIHGTSGPTDLKALIKRGLRAELNVQSFVTGQSEINLDFAPGSPATLHPNITSLPEIPTRQSTLQRAAEQLSQLPLHELVDNGLATLQSLRGLTAKLDQDLPPLLESLKTTSDRSGQMVANADKAIQALQGQLDATLAAVTQVATAGTRQFDQRGADLHAVLAQSDQTMRQVRDLIANLKTLTAERSASRANLESTLRDLSAAAASMRGFASDVERNPQLLLTGRRP